LLWWKKQVQNEWQPILDFWFRMHFMPRMRNHTLGFWVAGLAIALISAVPQRASASLAQSGPQHPASSAGGAAGASRQDSINAELARAIQLHQSGHFEEAISQYRLFLKEQPGNFIALANLGAALAHEGRYQEAIAEYEKALKISPGNPGVEFNLALAHYKALELEEAVSEFNHLYTIAPGNLKIALLLGDCYFRLGEYKKIVSLLGPLENKHPQERALIYLYGMALIRDGQLEKGEVEVNKILSHGNSADAYLMLGAARLAIYDYAGAIDELTRAIKLKPNLPLAHYLYGKALLTLGHRDEAMKQFREELAIDPNEFEPNLYLGVLLNQSEDFKDASPYLTRALQVRPGDPAVLYQMALAKIGTGNLEVAKTELEAIVKDSPDFLDAHVSLAQIYYRLHMKKDGDREKQAREQARGNKATQEAKQDTP
jgi:tetratricopeptide (TPR) repeat protein